MNHPPIIPLPNTPPAPVNGHLPVEDWLQQRLTSQFDPNNHAHYEYSLYGPVNALLTTQFPLSRKFLVKPQALLWAADEGFQHGPQANTSGGASGAEIPIYPDFAVVRAHEQLFNDWILCLIEIKREHESVITAEEQLAHYLERASNERWKVGILRGFVIVGSRCFALSIDTTERPRPRARRDANHELGRTDGIEFKQELFRIASKYWGDVQNEWTQTDFVGLHELP